MRNLLRFGRQPRNTVWQFGWGGDETLRDHPEWVRARQMIRRHETLTEELRRASGRRAGGADRVVALSERMIAESDTVMAAYRSDGEFRRQAITEYHEVNGQRPPDFPPLALPEHLGYERLIAIHEDERDYAAALDLAERAQSQGWPGNWEKRIGRLRGRLAR